MKTTVFIKPNTKHDERVEVGDDHVYTIYIKAPAVDGKANLAATKLLAKHFGIALSKVCLARGATSRYKMFEVDL